MRVNWSRSIITCKKGYRVFNLKTISGIIEASDQKSPLSLATNANRQQQQYDEECLEVLSLGFPDVNSLQ